MISVRRRKKITNGRSEGGEGARTQRGGEEMEGGLGEGGRRARVDEERERRGEGGQRKGRGRGEEGKRKGRGRGEEGERRGRVSDVGKREEGGIA